MIMSNPVSNNPHASAISEAKETFSNLLELSQLLNTGNLSLFFCFFLVYAGSGSGQSVLIWTDPEHRESKETVLCPLGWK